MPTGVHEQVAKRIANVRFTNMSGKTTAFFMNKKVNISEPLKILEFLKLF